jgi:hypothetical protein
MIPDASEIPREKLIQPDVMQAPVTWLASDDSNGINNMRFIAALWDDALPRDERLERAGAPVAWTQIPSKAFYPGD